MFDFVLVTAQTTTNEGMDVGGFIFLLIWGAIFGAIGVSMAKKRFRPAYMGGLLGFFLGFIGLIIIAVVGYKKGPPCVACSSPLQQSWVNGQVISARMCAMCGAQQRTAVTMPAPSPGAGPALPPMPS